MDSYLGKKVQGQGSMHIEGYQCGLKEEVCNKSWKDSQATNNSSFLWSKLGVRGSDGEFIFCYKFFCIVCILYQFHVLASGVALVRK